MLLTLSIFIYFVCFSQIWASKDGRIVDGELSENGQFPFAVAFYYEKAGSRSFCGGSLISNRWILTAAHCLYEADKFIIYLGNNNLNSVEMNSLMINSTKYVAHPNYVSSSLANDIGLIFLDTPVTFNDYIQPIELTSKTLGADEETIAIGWGATKNSDTSPSNLLYHVSLTTISNTECAKTFGSQIRNSMICAKAEGSKGICRGDSGGALIQEDAGGKKIHVALASFFGGQCEDSYPSGFTRTYDYVEWIKNVTSYNDNNSASFNQNLFLLLTSVVTIIVLFTQ